MIRYRDGKIVSTKGERFTQVTKAESEEMKKSYVNMPNFDYGYIWQRFDHCNINISLRLTYNVNYVAVTSEIVCIISFILSLWSLYTKYGERTCAYLLYSCDGNLTLAALNSIYANRRSNSRKRMEYIEAFESKSGILWQPRKIILVLSALHKYCISKLR